jgi:hypothetical protein
MTLLFLSACVGRASPTTPLPYSIELSPTDFVPAVDNPFFPLLPGTVLTYETTTDDAIERVVVEVIPGLREVMGIAATVVHDTVTLDSQLVEDTYDWYAQDKDGNVWYMGEDVSNYEDGEFKDKAGSWEAGEDGALPGVIMFGDPTAHLGETYRQEYYPGHAEDMADLLSLSATVSVPYGSFTGALETRDYTPLEPGHIEEKYYVEGIGLVKSLIPASGESENLIQYSHP